MSQPSDNRGSVVPDDVRIVEIFKCSSINIDLSK